MSDPRTVLIVEDDADLRSMFKTALSLAGYSVREAGDGYDALQSIDAHPPDLVILDLLLPTLSGTAVQQEIAAQVLTRDIPIMIVTGSPQPIDERTVACVLRKPVSPSVLVEAVGRCLGSGRARGAHH